MDTLLSRLDSLRGQAKVPGMTVGVVRDAEIVTLRGLGVADVRTQRPVTPDTPFNIASVSKPISGVVAMRIQELGQIDLDHPMVLYAGFEDFCRGAQERGGLFFGDWACDDPGISLRHVMSMSSNGRLGTSFFYNPVAFSWASRPLAERAGMPFSDLVALYVFDQAGMSRSARRHRDLPLREDLVADLAVPHALGPDSTPRVSHLPPPQGDGAAGGVVSTARDLVRFDLALNGSQLISEESKREMWSPGPGRPYGIGWFVTELRGLRVMWHTGLWEGAYSALYVRVPSHRAALVLLANSDGLRWESDLHEARLDRSAFAQLFIDWLIQ